ncbi:MAG TPA: hypothetical protein DDW94_04060 [Deltaproteobacteria bacterium]|nr:MAG: hypothetical protein A2Z79_10720 [Deltaproteobacteria bacterium GWA2_55_82]OGQ62904.1 MAG: hypothetical protein A3I81_06250 [Deltaproteobacteria bacterium RIFCSPLOWO2_02_FULL_55_12]OIJ72865.1 MAG: hypothetical protein A2V21_300485 [Deltaproteobacteria bacterium GWC2_55_46]HBG46146.1 hypothetical protein [Deltaproteobacteria bacterium]HCY11644.1 hypothetical protein [Deltaproteobacteria bacterium]
MQTDKLIDHLKYEIRLCKELVTVLQKETESMAGRDYKSLYEVVGQKENLVMRLNVLSQARGNLIEEAASALGLSREGEAPSLSSVIEHAGPGKKELDDCHKTILSLAFSIKEINSLNSLVMESSLENVKKTLGFLGNFLQSSVYKPGGTIEEFAVKGTRLNKGA